MLHLLSRNTLAHPHHDMTDAELLARYHADQSNHWLGILLHRYSLLLFGVCMKYLKNEEEARDAVQQVFLKVITELPKYQVNFFKSWIYMIARNQCLMKLRQAPIQTTIEIDDTSLMFADSNWENRSLNEKETVLNWLETCMEQLVPDQKTCIKLFFLQKKSYAEISEQTTFSLLQVKSHIQNGKRNLRILMEKKMKAENHEQL
jgi:RNA polymerase sigma factor (sigma-70 family)